MKIKVTIEDIGNKVSKKIHAKGFRQYEVCSVLPCTTSYSAEYYKPTAQLSINNKDSIKAFWSSVNNEITKNIAIKRDGNCAKRTLIWGALIEAATRIKSNDEEIAESGKQLLERIRYSAIQFEAQFQDYKKQYTNGIAPGHLKNFETLYEKYFKEQSQEIFSLFDNILNKKITVSELVYIANCDAVPGMLNPLIPNASLPLSLGLSALASFMMLEGLFKSVENIKPNHIKVRFDDLLSLGVPSQNHEILAFAKESGIYLEQHMLINGSHSNNYKYSKIAGKFPELEIPTITCATVGNVQTGHTFLVLSSEQLKIIAEEVKEFTENSVLPAILHDKFTKADIAGPFHQMISTKGNQRRRILNYLANDFCAKEHNITFASPYVNEVKKVVSNLIPEEMEEDFGIFFQDLKKTIENFVKPRIYTHIKFIDKVLCYLVALYNKIENGLYLNRTKTVVNNGMEEMYKVFDVQDPDRLATFSDLFKRASDSYGDLNNDGKVDRNKHYSSDSSEKNYQNDEEIESSTDGKTIKHSRRYLNELVEELRIPKYKSL